MNLVLFTFAFSCVLAKAKFRIQKEDPGTNEMCLMVHKATTTVSLPQACPTWCEKNMMKRNTQIVAKLDTQTGFCHCYNASSICDMQPAQQNNGFVFYVQGKLSQIASHKFGFP